MRSNVLDVEAVIRASRVLIVDDEFNMRKVIRTLLLSVGVTNVHEAPDGPTGLQAIKVHEPHVVILDWQMPGMMGPEFVKRVRSPATFPYPDVPIIMLTGHGEASRVIEAMRVGVHEFLLKPVSGKALRARLVSVLLKPRPMVRRGDYYGPEPRKLAGFNPEADSCGTQLGALVPEAPQGKAGSKPEVDPSTDHVIFVN
jgi:two-component system, chemotaxis family, chemotaxis protein CheY